MKEVVLNDHGIVNYKPLHPKYGCTEFAFCFHYERGKLKKVYITPEQQDVTSVCYIVDNIYADGWSITSYGVDEPRIWLGTLCKFHKSFSLRVYVPLNSDHFIIDKLSTLYFRFGNLKQQGKGI